MRRMFRERRWFWNFRQANKYRRYAEGAILVVKSSTMSAIAKAGLEFQQQLEVLSEILENKCKRISELQGTIDSLKRQNKELQAELLAKDGIIKKQIIMMEEAKPKEAKYVKAGNQYYCSNCNADFQHFELYNKYCPECGAHFSNFRKG